MYCGLRWMPSLVSLISTAPSTPRWSTTTSLMAIEFQISIEFVVENHRTIKDGFSRQIYRAPTRICVSWALSFRQCQFSQLNSTTGIMSRTFQLFLTIVLLINVSNACEKDHPIQPKQYYWNNVYSPKLWTHPYNYDYHTYQPLISFSGNLQSSTDVNTWTQNS